MEPLTGRLKALFGVLMILWTGTVCGLFIVDSQHLTHTVKDLAMAEARACLNKDLATRLWAASHGGVYVPISENTRPNPFLSHLPERDIRTPAGKSLTLLNPAYMIRRIMEEYAQLYGVRGRIVGLRHFSEATAPDDWEKSALLAFRSGNEELMEFSDIDGAPFLRAMRALATEPDCLGCHAHQGYQVGDIRGGVSVSVPLASYFNYRSQELKVHGLSFAVLWMIGIGGIIWAERRLAFSMQKRDHAEAVLRASEEQLRNLSARLLQQQEIERTDIAREIHEDIAQCLSAIKLRVEGVLDERDREGIRLPAETLQPVVSDIKHAVRSIRRLAQKLQPLMFGYLGIGSAVSWICRETANANPGLRIEARIEAEESRISNRLRIAVYRTLEDALKDISGHGQTGRSEVLLQEVQQRIVLTLKTPTSWVFQDAGAAGGDPNELLDVPKVRRRVESSGGNFKFEVSLTGEATLTASWPLG